MAGNTGGDIFTRVDDRNDRFRVFNYVINNRVAINGHTVAGVRFTMDPKVLRGARIEGEITPPLEANLLKNVSMMFQVGEERYFCKTNCEEVDGAKVLLDVSEPLFKLQRRDSYRLALSMIKGSIFNIREINGKEAKGSVSLFNISGGGCAIELQPQDLATLQQRDSIRGQLLVPGHIDELIEAEVKYCKPRGSLGSGIKTIGLQFVGLAPIQEQQIIQAIFDLHRAHFSRVDLEKFRT